MALTHIPCGEESLSTDLKWAPKERSQRIQALTHTSGSDLQLQQDFTAPLGEKTALDGQP